MYSEPGSIKPIGAHREEMVGPRALGAKATVRPRGFVGISQQPARDASENRLRRRLVLTGTRGATCTPWPPVLAVRRVRTTSLQQTERPQHEAARRTLIIAAPRTSRVAEPLLPQALGSFRHRALPPPPRSPPPRSPSPPSFGDESTSGDRRAKHAFPSGSSISSALSRGCIGSSASSRTTNRTRNASTLAASAAAVNAGTDPDEIGGDSSAGRYAEGPSTRMNLFTAVNAGLRTAMETDDSAVRNYRRRLCKVMVLTQKIYSWGSSSGMI